MRGIRGILEKTQQGTLDVTPWMEWFLGCLGRAIDGTETTLSAVMRKARFWERQAGQTINGRQRAMLNRLVDGSHREPHDHEVGHAHEVLA